jgi:hypothetical protein
VPPGSRRGVAPDAAAEAFASALLAFEAKVSVELDRLDRQRGTAANRQVMGDLRRAFRGLQARLPQYELPAVDGDGGPETRAAGSASGVLPVGSPPPPETSAEVSDGGADAPEPAAAEDDDRDDVGSSPGVLDLFPPGPLAAVTVTPAEVEIPIGRERRVHARATDADGRKLDDVTFEWVSESPVVSVVSLAPSGRRPALIVAATARAGTREAVRVTARQGDRVVTAQVTVLVSVVDATQNAQLGIPEPELLDEPTASWRSRFDGQRWQVNAAHEDFAALASEPRTRVRYLLTLLAKEIVQRTHGGPGTEAALEGLVEILAHAERNLRGM